MTKAETAARLYIAAHTQEILEAAAQYRLTLQNKVEEPTPPCRSIAYVKYNEYLNEWAARRGALIALINGPDAPTQAAPARNTDTDRNTDHAQRG